MVDRVRDLVLLVLLATTEVVTHVTEFNNSDTNVGDKRTRREAKERKHRSLSDGEYRSMYRVSLEVFHHIVDRIEDEITNGNSQMSAELMVALYLEHCAHGTALRVLCIEYGIDICT